MSAMTSTARTFATQFWMIAGALGFSTSLVIAQEASSTRPRQPADIDHTQYLRGVEDLERLRILCRRLTVTARATLEARAKDPTPENRRDALNAAEVLRILRASDPKSLKALCQNITLSSNEWEPRPLGGYVAAQALVEIGGRPAVEAIFSSMRSKVDRKGLLLRAFALREIDSQEIASERVRIEIKATEAKSREEIPFRDIYLPNLRQVQGWLNDPTFGIQENWPAYN